MSERFKTDGRCASHDEPACPSCLTYDKADLERALASERKAREEAQAKLAEIKRELGCGEVDQERALVFIHNSLTDEREVREDRDALEAEVERLKAQKDGAYAERNQVVVAFVRLAWAFGCAGGVAQHPALDVDWEDDWRTILFADLPTGQVSWHFHDSERHLLADLPPYGGKWDGHDTPEKYRRLNAWRPQSPLFAEKRRALEAEAGLVATQKALSGLCDRIFSEPDMSGHLKRLVFKGDGNGHANSDALRAARAALAPPATGALEAFAWRLIELVLERPGSWPNNWREHKDTRARLAAIVARALGQEGK